MDRPESPIGLERNSSTSSGRLPRQPTIDAKGKIYFVASNRNAEYVRISNKMPANHIARVFSGLWGLDPPALIITATGGAQDFAVDPALKEAFCRGLIRAVRSTRAWVISGGTSAGVMDLIGRAFNSYLPVDMQNRCPLIGVSTYGIIIDRDTLSGGPAEVEYEQSVSNSAKGAGLQIHHSHFLLVDNGTEEKWGVEIESRTKLEEYYSKEQSVPIVQIVLSGGPGTFKTILESVKLGFPVVIVRGTAGAADAIGDYATLASLARQLARQITSLKTENVGQMNQEAIASEIEVLQEKHKSIEAEMRALAKDRKADESILQEICQHGHLVFFENNRQEDDTSTHTSDFNKALLMAILKDTQRSSIVDKLRLCIEFNRVDVVESLFAEASPTVEELTTALQFALELIASRPIQDLSDAPAIVDFLLRKGACIVPDYRSLSKSPCGINFARLFISIEANDAMRQILHHVDYISKFFLGIQTRAAWAMQYWWRSRRRRIQEAAAAGEGGENSNETTTTAATAEGSGSGPATASRVMEAAARFQEVLSKLRDEMQNSPLLKLEHAAELVNVWLDGQSRAKRDVNEYFAGLARDFNGVITPITAGHWVTSEVSLVDQLIEVLIKQQRHLQAEPQTHEAFRMLFFSTPSAHHSSGSFSASFSNSGPIRAPPQEELYVRSVSDLIVWSLYKRNSPALALVLLKYCNYPIHSALACGHWVKNISQQPHEKLEKMASSILNECDSEGGKLGEKVLLQPSPHWNGQNGVSLATTFEQREFIAHDAYQALLDKQWTSVADSDGAIRLAGDGMDMLFRSIFYILSLGLLCRNVVDGEGLKYFSFFSIPLVKFGLATALHMMYLVLYTSVCLDAITLTPDFYEGMLFFWTFSLIVREFTQALEIYKQNHSFASYFHSFWNKLDVVYLTTIIVYGISRTYIWHLHVRGLYPEADLRLYLSYVHELLAMNSILAYLRLLDRFSLSSVLGPVLIMIRKMVMDVVAFLSILLVFLMGFGLTFTVFLRPLDSPPISFVDLLNSNGNL